MVFYFTLAVLPLQELSPWETKLSFRDIILTSNKSLLEKPWSGSCSAEVSDWSNMHIILFHHCKNNKTLTAIAFSVLSLTKTQVLKKFCETTNFPSLDKLLKTYKLF